VRGSGELPTTAASELSGVTARMNAALGVRFLPDDLRAAFLVAFCRAAAFLGRFLALLRAAVFFLVAIACLPVNVRTCVPRDLRNYRDKQYTTAANFQ